jgi:hypothetical protein
LTPQKGHLKTNVNGVDPRFWRAIGEVAANPDFAGGTLLRQLTVAQSVLEPHNSNMTQASLARLWRVARAVICVLLVGYGLLFLLARIHESLVRSRSEAMYEEFLKLQPGRTTKLDIELLVRRAGSRNSDVRCEGDGCEYTIGNVWGQSRWSAILRIGHDHQPTSELLLKTERDLLSYASFSIGILVPKGYGTREERKWLGDPNYVPYSSGEYMLFGRALLVTVLPDTRLKANPDYRIWGPSGCTNCLAIWVSALPSVAPAKRKQIFQIGFDCMTRWSVCTDKEDIMPAAGRERAKELALEGLTSEIGP